MVKLLGNQFLVSLSKKNIGQLVAKIFEYILDFKLNLNLSTQIMTVLNLSVGSYLDLSAVEQVVSRESYFKFIEEEFIENIYQKESDLRVGNDPLNQFRNLFLGTVQKINKVFISKFEHIHTYLKMRRFSFFRPERLAIPKIFIPFNLLPEEHTSVVRFELEELLRTDCKISSVTIITIFAQLARNKNFKVDHWFVKTIINQLERVPSELAKSNKRKQFREIKRVACLLSSILLNNTNGQETTDLILSYIVGYFDTITDGFHQKTPVNISKLYNQILFTRFLYSYSIHSYYLKKNHNEKYQSIRSKLHPVLKKMINFAIFDKVDGLKKALIGLCYLEREDFLDYILTKIQFSFGFEEFAKKQVIEILDSMTDIVPTDEKYSHHLQWILPSLLKELENSNQEQFTKILGCFASIFEIFIDINKVEGCSHLKRMQDSIDEAAIILFDTAMKKGESFSLDQNLISTLFLMNDYVSKKLKEKILELVKKGFENINPTTSEILLSRCLRFYPAETELALESCLVNKCLNKSNDEKISIDSLTLSPILRSFGVTEVPYSLSSTNEATLNRQLRLVRPVATSCIQVSDKLFNLVLTFVCLAFESQYESVVNSAALFFESIREGFLPKTISYSSNLVARVSADPHQSIKIIIPDIDQKEKITKLAQNFIYHSVSISDKLMRDILKDNLKPEDPRSKVVELFEQTLTEKEQAEVAIVEISNKLIGSVKIVLSLFDGYWTQYSSLRSPKLASVIDEFRGRFVDFCVRSKAFTNHKIRSLFSSFCINKQNASFLDYSKTAQFDSIAKSFCDLRPYIKFIDNSSKRRFVQHYIQGILKVLSYFHPESLPDLETVDVAKILPSYEAANRALPKYTPDKMWLFSKENTEKRQKIQTELISLSFTIFPYVSGRGIKNLFNLYKQSWILLEENNIREYLLEPLLLVIQIEQSNQERYSKTAIIIENTVSIVMKQISLQSETTASTILQLVDAFAQKGTFSLISGSFLNLTNYLTANTFLLANNSWVADLEKNLEELEQKKDSDLTLLKFISSITRITLNYRHWSTKFRARYFLALIEKIGSKDINKKIVAMSQMVFFNRLMKATDYIEKKVRVDLNIIEDREGLISVQSTHNFFTEIRRRVGFGKDFIETPGISAQQLAAFDQISTESYPLVNNDPSLQYMPFEAHSFDCKEETVKEVRSMISTEKTIERLEGIFVEFIKQAISEYSESVEDKNLTIKYHYVENYVDTKGNRTFGRESLIYGTMRLVNLMLGYESSARVVERLEREVEEKNSDYKKVILINLCACIGGSIAYSDEEFKLLAVRASKTIQPLMNQISIKHMDTFWLYCAIAFKSSTNFKRIKIFFDEVEAAMRRESNQDRGYWILTLLFENTVTNNLTSDRLIRLIKDDIPLLDTDELKNISTLSKYYMTILSNRYLRSTSLKHSSSHILSEDTPDNEIFRPCLLFEGIDILENFKNFISDIKSKRIIMRLEVAKLMAGLLAYKNIDDQNLEVMKGLTSVILTLDTNEDHGISILVQGVHKVIDHVRMRVSGSEKVQDKVLSFLIESYQNVTSIECSKSLLKFVRPFVGSAISPVLESFISRLARDQRINMRDSIDSTMRYDIFSRLSNEVIYSYAKKLFKSIDSTLSEK